MTSFQMEIFKKKLDSGLKTVARVLDVNRNPQLAGDVHHKYNDKYQIAEFLTAAASASVLTSLKIAGLTTDKLLEVTKRSGTKAVTLQFKSESSCSFIKREEREIEGPKHVTEVSGAMNLKSTSKTITKVTEYFWNQEIEFGFLIYFGSDPTDCVELTSRKLSTTLKTRSESPPYANTSHPVLKLPLTWIINLLTEEAKVDFTINRNASTCHTPRRNPDVEKAISFFNELDVWSREVDDILKGWMVMEQENPVDMQMISAVDVFIPIVPLLEEINSDVPRLQETKTDPSTALPPSDLQLFLDEQQRSLSEKIGEIEKRFPENGLTAKYIASLRVINLHNISISDAYLSGVNYIENLLRQQLVTALGKEVTATDFSMYMGFHSRKIFSEEYQPKKLSYAVRVSGHNPEGFFGIEQVNNEPGEIDEPVLSIVKKLDNSQPMKFALNASTAIRFSGDKYIHSLINHRFSSFGNSFNLVANARQFSCYVVLLGQIGGPDLFLPKHALVIKNKDDLKIPLLLEEVPSPKQFKSSIESLSPEQQRFAKSYRSMQLEATLFGLCVIQIKPQLERVLNLPSDSLTKEIRLSQDLLELFSTYQISSDLLSFQCDDCEDSDEISTKVKVDQVRSHVAAMKEIIKTSKEEELEEEKRKAEIAKQSAIQSFGVDPCSGGGWSSEQPQSADMFFTAAASGGGPFASPQGCTGQAFGFSSAATPMGFSSVATPMGFSSAAAPMMSTLPSSAPAPPSEPEQPRETCKTTPPKTSDGQLVRDISALPDILESKFEALDSDDSLRPTIIKTGETWIKKSLKGLLSKPTESVLHDDDQKSERNKAFDLLDSLTRSGAMDVPDAELHVIVASTHCFDKNVMDTVIENNVNPIEKVERSILIAASAIHDKPPAELLSCDQTERIKSHAPQLF